MVSLSTDLWVYALVRRVQLGGSFATIVRKGDATGGAVAVKTYDPRSRACLPLHARHARRRDGVDAAGSQ